MVLNSSLIFVDCDSDDCFDYHLLDLPSLCPDCIHDFDGLGISPIICDHVDNKD